MSKHIHFNAESRSFIFAEDVGGPGTPGANLVTGAEPQSEPNAGDWWLNALNFEVSEFVGDQWVVRGTLRRGQAVPGERGLPGPQGIQGIKGDPGDVGPQGSQGPQGPQGIQGIKGDSGNIGPAGPQGPQGSQGPQGLTGLQGIKGDTGDGGPQGPQGSQGSQGLTGPQGIKGDTGDGGGMVPGYFGMNDWMGVVKRIGSVTLGTSIQKMIYCPSNHYLYALDNDGVGTVKVLNPLNNTTVASFALPSGLGVGTGMAYSPVNDKLYIVTQSNSVVVIDPATNALAPVQPIGVGSSPVAIEYCPANDRLYVSNAESSTISVIDPSLNTVVATIPLSAMPGQMAYSPVNDKLYIVTQSNSVVVIDPVNHSPMTGISVGEGPLSISYCPVNNRIYTTNPGEGTISVIDPMDNTVPYTMGISAGLPQGIIYCPDTRRMMATTVFPGKVIAIEPTVYSGGRETVAVALTGSGNVSQNLVYCPVNQRKYVLQGDSGVLIFS
ncbi:MAG: hypothetical protein HQL76_06265 [Magnetococcales bacterium]|nr:hypothetical protein [Magnetococcales bacterium]